jgi:hypothetical protein
MQQLFCNNHLGLITKNNEVFMGIGEPSWQSQSDPQVDQMKKQLEKIKSDVTNLSQFRFAR